MYIIFTGFLNVGSIYRHVRLFRHLNRTNHLLPT
jgi:hypothetical protein